MNFKLQKTCLISRSSLWMRRIVPSVTDLKGVGRRWLALAVFLAVANVAWAGSIFLTGHDPDFHASLGGNAVGARNINTAAIGFIRDPGFNPFVVAGSRFLFVQSNIAPPGGHTDGKAGIIAKKPASRPS